MGTTHSRRQINGEISPVSSSKDSPYFDKVGGRKLFFTRSNMSDDERTSKHKKKEDSEGTLNRKRSSTISEGNKGGLVESQTPRNIYTVFRWDKGGKNVYVSGSWDNWKSKIPLVHSQGNFTTILQIPEGTHQYKFYVDSKWLHDDKQSTINNDLGTQNNVIEVKKTDFEVFDALAVDIASLRHDKHINSTPPPSPNFSSTLDAPPNPDLPYLEDAHELLQYGQRVPPRIAAAGGATPPFLPPQLLQVPLNRDIPYNFEPALLPEPATRAVLNHLYALSIKDGVLVLSCTHRHKKKYVTTLFYKQ
ncbi:unnamed protein product, partial [Gordionus sp. m RMFG-2023]